MTQEQKKKFGCALIEARNKKGATQRDCATQCGVSIVSYQNWEHGVCSPKSDKMKQICEFLSIDPGEYQ